MKDPTVENHPAFNTQPSSSSRAGWGSPNPSREGTEGQRQHTENPYSTQTSKRQTHPVILVLCLLIPGAEPPFPARASRLPSPQPPVGSRVISARPRGERPAPSSRLGAFDPRRGGEDKANFLGWTSPCEQSILVSSFPPPRLAPSLALDALCGQE